MVTVLPVSSTAIVQRLARAQPADPSLLSRFLRLMPTPASQRTAPVKKLLPRRQSPVLRFVLFRGPTPPVVSRPKRVFLGLRVGTWIRVALRHEITDRDSAVVVLHVLLPVRGTQGTLPAGTRLIAHVQAATGARVQLTVSEAVTPQDRRLPLSAVVFDRQFRRGLSGFVQGRRRAAVLAAFARSLVSTADTAFSMFDAQASLTSQALGSVGRGTLGAAVPWRAVRRVLYVPAQRAYVQTQKRS